MKRLFVYLTFLFSVLYPVITNGQLTTFKTFISGTENINAISAHEVSNDMYIFHGYYDSSRIRFLHYFDSNGNSLKIDTLTNWNVNSPSLSQLKHISKESNLYFLEYKFNNVELHKTDSLGNIIWSSLLIDSLSVLNQDEIDQMKIFELNNGQILFLGITPGHNYNLIKINSTGSIIMDVLYSPINAISQNFNYKDSIIYLSLVWPSSYNVRIVTFNLNGNLINMSSEIIGSNASIGSAIHPISSNRILIYNSYYTSSPWSPFPEELIMNNNSMSQIWKTYRSDTIRNKELLLSNPRLNEIINGRSDEFVIHGHDTVNKVFIQGYDLNGFLNWSWRSDSIMFKPWHHKDLIKTKDGGYLFVANTPENPLKKGIIIKLDSVGNQLNSIETFINESQTKIFPNPVNETLQIQSGDCIDEIIIQNLTGNTLLNQEVNHNKAIVDVSSFLNGLYFLTTILVNGTSQTQKVIIQH